MSGRDLHPDADPLLGVRVGSYEITERLGAGGMGVVYRARHETLGREAALKALTLGGGGDPSRRERFVQEARAASALDHPAIVTIYDIVTEGDSDYLIMEYLEGRTLDQVVGAGGLAPARAIDYVLQVARALAAAHQQGIVHRDIKPSNVMATASGQVKVLDFGLAKLVQPEVSDDEAPTRLTHDGSVMGTPDYMSPEQALGREIDARSDVFSLGVVLYELLCGERPFRGDNWVEVAHAICSAEPIPISSVRADLPAGIDAVLRRALQKNREERFASMGEMAEALAEIAADLPSVDDTPNVTGAMTAAMPSGTGSIVAGRAGSSSTRKVALAAGVVAIVIVAVMLMPATRNVLLGAGERGVGAAEQAVELTPFEYFERGSELLESYYRAGNLDEAIASFEAALAQDPVYPTAHAGLGIALWTRYQSENGDPLILARAVESARQAVALNEHLALAHRALALTLSEQGDTVAAAAEIEEAGRLDPGSAEVAFVRGLLAAEEGDDDAAIDHLREAIGKGPDSWRYHSELGSRYYSASLYDEAADEFRIVTEMTPDNTIGFQSLGAILHMLGRVDEAAGAMQMALQIQPGAKGYSNLGTLFYFEARYTDAAAAFQKAVDLEPNEYTFWVNLGDAYRWVSGRDASAEEAFTRAIQLMREALEGGPGSLYLRTMLAESLVKRASEGDVKEALGMLSALEAEVGDDADSWFSMAKAYEIAGDREAALRALEPALAGGYSTQEVSNEPELTELRNDVHYHRLALRFQ